MFADDIPQCLDPDRAQLCRRRRRRTTTRMMAEFFTKLSICVLSWFFVTDHQHPRSEVFLETMMPHDLLLRWNSLQIPNMVILSPNSFPFIDILDFKADWKRGKKQDNMIGAPPMEALNATKKSVASGRTPWRRAVAMARAQIHCVCCVKRRSNSRPTEFLDWVRWILFKPQFHSSPWFVFFFALDALESTFY